MTSSALSWAHPLVQEWFLNKFGSPTEPQIQGWPAILSGNHTLISAPTGSGKTFSAFLICINRLVTQALSQQLADETQVIYVSPLKALSNDIQKNLAQPLAEIQALAEARGLAMQEIRVMVRTGDTPTKERASMLKKPPHILVTTPESLYILLTAQKSREFLRTASTLIVDEIHAMADDKRGAHLTLSLERLQALCSHPILRIGLSATQKPMEVVAAFLTGADRPLPILVNIGHRRQLDLGIEVPQQELGAIASNEMWDEIYDRIAELSFEHRSILVFVNTRRLSERLAHHLAERLGEEVVAAHHGSLSRKLRLAAEEKLKKGELKILVATASLELGIDIGNIDLVCQIGSPRSIAVALQRIGRAGHWRGAIPKGRIFATTRDELLECAALVQAIIEGDLDTLIIPHEPLDILAQQIVAMCAVEDWKVEDLFKLIHHAYPYAKLSREKFNTLLTMLSEGISGTRGRYGAYLFYDQLHGILSGRRGSRLTAITNGGAIADNGLYTVIAEPEGVMVGTLDEDFAVESNRGDIILLGSTSWQIHRVESASGRVLVHDAHGAPPNVPFWRGEAPGRTFELSSHVANLREQLSMQLQGDAQSYKTNPTAKGATQAWLEKTCYMSATAAAQLIDYILQGRAILTAMPTQQRVIAERFFDEGGGMQLVIHAPFGARINKAWGLALRKRFCRSFNFELQAAATDDGILISLAEQHSFPLADVFHFLHPNTVKEVLTQAVLQSPLFAARWRWDAMRALALIRFRGGKKVPPQFIRMRAEDLLAAVFPDAAACQDNIDADNITIPEHPLIEEALKDVLHEALDIDGLIEVLNKIQSGEIKYIAIDTPVPSVFAHEIVNANPYAYLDDAPLEERRARAVEMRRMLPEPLLKEVGRLDPTVIAEVKQQAWPDVRNENELQDTLHTLIAIPSELKNILAPWQIYFESLVEKGRATLAHVEEKRFWLAIEKTQTFLAIYPQAKFIPTLKFLPQPTPNEEEAILLLVRGWMLHMGPVTAEQLSLDFSLPIEKIQHSLLKLETQGAILRGNFVQAEGIEWCNRRLLARIHHLTLAKLRREIEPVTQQQFSRWLLIWQHVAPGTQLRGQQGLLEVIKQLQGFEAPANAWESQILAKRIKQFSPDLLDKLCLSGQIGWGRFFTNKKTLTELTEQENLPLKGIRATSIVPITFFIRGEADWLFTDNSAQENLSQLSKTAQDIYDYLKENGASFFSDIVPRVGHLKSQVEMGLWELVAAGLVTADGFDNLRALVDVKRRTGQKRRRIRMPRHSVGRWALLHNNIKPSAEHVEAQCWTLLKRYGVVFRDLLVREKILNWRELLLAFRHLEAKGEIRGGRFVAGFLGEQFALPIAVESLRTIKKIEETGETVKISAADPLNLIGIILPGSRISRISGKTITLKDGIVIHTEKL